MKDYPTNDSLHQFDLLPPSFRYRHRLHGVFCGWVALICFLIAVLVGGTAVTIMRTLQTNRTNQQIASTALPLLDLRRKVFHLQESNKQRQQWCRWVESTKPDDSMVQVLAAVAAASQASDSSRASTQARTSDRQITIDSVSLRLPLEFPISSSEPPAWAVPFLTIIARPTSTDLVQPWVERLNGFDRIAAVSLADDTNERVSKLQSTNEEDMSVRLTATPVATRVQP